MIFLNLTKGKIFQAVDENNRLTKWKIQDVKASPFGTTYVLVPIGETLKKFAEKLKKMKEENSFLEDLQNMTLEQYAKIEVVSDWFWNKTIIPSSGASVNLIYDKNNWGAELIGVADDEHLSEFLWEVQKRRCYSDSEMKKNIFTKNQPLNDFVYTPVFVREKSEGNEK